MGNIADFNLGGKCLTTVGLLKKKSDGCKISRSILHIKCRRISQFSENNEPSVRAGLAQSMLTLATGLDGQGIESLSGQGFPHPARQAFMCHQTSTRISTTHAK